MFLSCKEVLLWEHGDLEKQMSTLIILDYNLFSNEWFYENKSVVCSVKMRQVIALGFLQRAASCVRLLNIVSTNNTIQMSSRSFQDNKFNCCQQ